MTLRELRESKQLTQEALAQRARVSLRQYCNVEKGKGEPLLCTVGRVARALECSIDIVALAIEETKAS